MNCLTRTGVSPAAQESLSRHVGRRPGLITVATAGFFILAVQTGCTDRDSATRGEVSGTVTLDGTPVPGGTIVFRPTGTTQGPTAGGEILDGKYFIPRKAGPAAGENIVQFVGAIKSGKKVMDRGQEMDEWIDAFPEKYRDKSTEVRKIISGKNTLDFDLKSK